MYRCCSLINFCEEVKQSQSTVLSSNCHCQGSLMGSMMLTVVFSHVKHSVTLIIDGACNTFYVASKLCMIEVIMTF